MSQTTRRQAIFPRGVQWLGFLACGLMLLGVGCVSGGTKKSSSAKIAKNVESSAPELSSRNHSLLAVYSAEIERAADKIIAESPSPTAQRLALEWKAEAIPVIQASLLNTDPVAAVLDTWAFIHQMSAFMERSPQKQELGEFHPLVAETVKNLDGEMERIVRLGAPNADIADLRKRVVAWAEAHPIRVSLAGRESVDPELIKKTELSGMGTRASIKALGESIGDLTARLDTYNVYMPKQARWQAELLLGDVARDPKLSVALSNLNSLSNTAARASSKMDTLPDLVDQAREGVRADVDAQRSALQTFLKEERLETLKALQQERIATLAAMRGERLAATADLRTERQVVLQALRNDEEEVMNDLDTLSNKAIQDFDARARKLIDHFFVRAFELMLVVLILCILAAWILLRWLPISVLKPGALDR
jgi:hypothetical protein